MAINRTTLSLSKLVSAATIDTNIFIPEEGEFFITEFSGEAAFSVSSFCSLVWDYDGSNTVIWSTAGSVIKPLEVNLTGDGVKKLAIILDNGLSSVVYMSAEAKIIQEV